MIIQANITTAQPPLFSLRLSDRTGPLRHLLSILLVAAVYFGAAKLGLSLAFINASVSAVWPPSGVAIAAVLLFGYRIWPGILVGAFLANALTPVSLPTAGVIAGGNTVEAIAAGFLLYRVGFQITLERVTDISKLIIIALLATMISATMGNLALCVGHSASWRDFGGLWLTWWLGDAVGALIVTPLLLAWFGASTHNLSKLRYIEGLIVMTLLAVAATATFTGTTLIPIKYYPLARLTVPFFLYSAFRLGYRGVTLGTVIVSVFAAWGTARGLGPFAGRAASDTLLLLQLFAGSNAVTFLFLVAVIQERRGTEATLRDNQRRLASNLAVTRILADSPDLADAAPRILHTISDTLGWQVGAMWTPDDASGSLRCFVIWRDPSAPVEKFVAESRSRRFEAGVGLPGRVWASRSPTWIEDLSRDVNFPRATVAVGDGLRSAFGFPLMFSDKFLGVMEFFSPQIREPDEAMLAMFGGIGSQIGLFIERREAETAMRELAAIVESAEDAVMGKDLQGRITSWNASAEKLLGYTAQEIVGREIFLLVPPEFHDDEREILAKLRRGESIAPLETIRRAKNGAEINVSLMISPVRSAEGIVFGGSTIARDITERKLAEKERERLLRREQDARAEAEAANRIKDEFLASVSHELRTPLNAIVGWTGLLHAGMLDQKGRDQAVEIIDRNAKLQVRLIEDLLDVSRIVSGNIRFDPRPVSFIDVIESAVDSVKPAAVAKNIQLRVELDQSAGLVQGDPDRLQQVVWNLLVNAVKFTPDAGRVKVELRPAGAFAEMIISDNGEGIREDFLPHVFERFRQADSTTTRRHRGIGIGLAIVRHLVDLHQGSVTVESDGEGKGAIVRVTIPLLGRNGGRSQ